MFPEGRFLEFLIVGIVALVVVGPKDLPPLLRRLGQFMAKLRGMAAEFRASFDEMARQSELDELRKEVEAMRRGQLADIATHSGHAEMQATVSEIESSLSGVGVQLHPPMSYQYTEMQSAAPAEPVVEPAAPVKPARKPRAAKPAARPAAAKAPAKAKAAPAKPASAKLATKPSTKAAAKPTAARRPRTRKTEAGA